MAVTRVTCSAGDGNEWRQWQWTGTSTERTGGISTVGGGEEVTTGEEIDRGDGVGKEEPLGGGVCLGIQSLTFSVERGWVVHSRVVMVEERVFGDKEQEVRVVVDVKEGELIVFDGRCCEWEKTEGRKWRGGVSYSPPGWTWGVSTPTRLSRSLLWLNIPSIRSGTFVLSGNLCGARSSQSHILLLLLLNWMAELGSSGCGPCFLSKA